MDSPSKLVSSNDLKLEKLKKIKYKEDLDLQIQMKTQLKTLNTPERNFQYKTQLNSIKEYDDKKKQNDRSYYKIFEEDNLNTVQTKIIQQQHIKNTEKIKQQLEFEKIQQKINKELENEKMLKQQRIQTEKNELSKQLTIKIIKNQLLQIEKDREKKLIEKKIHEMKNNEGKYKETYENRLKRIEEKMKNYKPVVESDQYKHDLIKKRNEEWEIITSQKLLIKKKLEQESIERAKSQIRLELSKQIEYKNQQKQKEWRESLLLQQAARLEASQENYNRYLLKKKKIKERTELKKYYEGQVKDQRSHSLGKIITNKREMFYNNSNKNNLQGIPGVYSVVSSAKDVYRKLHGDDKISKFYSLSNSPKKQANSIEKNNGIELPKSEESYNTPYESSDPYKHNPITNPIGSILPRVMPGQRATKVFK